jgi:hypothetical protein
MTDSELLDWCLDQLGIDREWAAHAAGCDACWIDFGYEYGGASKCRPYRFDHNEIVYGCQTRQQHQWAQMTQQILGPMMEQALRPTPFKFLVEKRPVEGETVTFRRI